MTCDPERIHSNFIQSTSGLDRLQEGFLNFTGCDVTEMLDESRVSKHHNNNNGVTRGSNFATNDYE